MLPQRQRLRREKDIARVRRMRPISRGALMSVRKYSRGDNDPSRFAVVAGKRVSKKAVDRNRVARLIRAALFEVTPSVPDGNDILAVAHRPADHYDFNKCKDELVYHMQNIGAWNE